MSKQSITIEVDLIGKATSLSETIGKLQSDLSKLDLGKGLQESFKTNFAVINSEIEKIQNIAAKGKINVIDDKQIQKSLSAIETAYASVLHKLESEGVNTSFLKQDKKAIDALTTANKNYTNSVKETRSEYNKLAKELEKIQDSQKDSRGKIESKRVLSDSDYKKLQDEVQRLEAEKKAATSARGTAAGQLTRKYGKGWQQDTSKISTEELEKYNEKAERAEALTEQLKTKQDQLNNSISNSAKTKAIGDLDSALQKIKDSMAKVDDAASFEKIKQELLAIKDVDWGSLGIDINSINNVEQLNAALTKLGTDAGEQAKQVIANIGGNSQVASDQLNNARTAVDGYTKSLQEMTDRERDIEGIKSRITYFFGLANAINLARRAMRQAFNAVKELDAAMTETAVVTDFSVGDMWDQLPRYTEVANKLGATTLGAYQTMTLFYQQGLDTNEAFALGAETMEMARIAGLDYADATDKMTAALRGFNMELNEASAQRVNDVYSELAAITAADTEEIANAMTKTASIAHNANMEFETTAAFLSQIIETTRESAETAGTAMKTVIARFQELKKDPSEIGEVDGEIVDANKIETALRSVGVALRDSTGQFRDLDDVFLELASKWDGLDTNTQRYIATIAAGSRQQSRFIAMMSNYERTMELVNAANNSAGASQNQFNKTLESLGAKLNNLKNAWNEFTMGITNNQAIKFGVDALTWLLNIINKVTGAAGNEGIGGLITAISKLTFAWAALKSGRAIFNSVFSGFGTQAALSMKDSFTKEFGKEAGFRKMFTGMKTGILDTKTLDEYNKKVGTITAAQNKYNSIVKDEFKLSKMKTQTQNQLIKAEQSYYNAIGLSKTQQASAMAMTKMGIAVDEAAALTKVGVTQKQLEEIAVQRLGKNATKEQIAAKMKEIAAEEAGRISKQSNIMLKLQEIVFTKMGIVSNIAHALSEKLVAKGISIKNAQMLISLGLIGLIIAAVIGLIALIVLLVKHLKSISPEGKLKAAEEAAKKASEQVEKLNEEFNTLKESLDSIAEKRAALDELTYGTQEWRDAVREVNNEMLKVAQLDPDLAPFITNNNGILEFDYNKTNYKGQTYDDVMEQKQVDLETAQQIDIGSKIEVEYEEIDKERATNTSGIQVGVDYGVADPGLQYISGQTLSEEYVSQMNEQIARAMATGELITTGDEEYDREAFIDYLGKEFGYTGQVAEDMADHLVIGRDGLLQFGNALLESEGQIAAYTDTLVASAVANSGLVDEEADIAQTYLDSRIDGIIESEKERLRSTELGDAEKEEYARIMGYTYDNDNGNFYSLDAEGNKVKEEGITDDLIIEQIAYSNAIEIGTNQMKGFVGAIDKVGGAFGTLMKETYAAADGMGITQDSLKEFFKDTGINYSDGLNDTERLALMGEVNEDGTIKKGNSSILANQWNAMDDAMKSYFGSYEEFANYQIDMWNNAALAYANATELIGDTFTEGSGISAMLDGLITEFKLTAGEAKALSNALYDVAMNGGDANGFLNQMDLILSGIKNPEDRDRALALINSTDWTDTEEVDKTIAALKDMGIEVGEGFREQILKATNAVRKFDMDKINSELEKTGEAIDIITEKAENDEVIYSKEERDKLVAAGADSEKFVRTGIDEYTYIGETNELLASIEKITAQILGEVKGDLEEEIATGREVDAFGEKKTNVAGYSTNADVVEALKSGKVIIGEVNADPALAGYSFMSPAVIEKFARDFGINPEGLDTQGIIDAIITRWDSYYGKAEGWQAELDTYNSEMGTLNYANMDPQEIMNQGTYQARTEYIGVQGVGYIENQVEVQDDSGLTYFTDEAGKAVEGLIAQEEGFNHVLDGVTGALKKQGKEIAKDTNFLKLHTLSFIKAQKEVDRMNEVLEENNEILKSGDTESVAYGKAIANVTEEAKKVFGTHIEEPFVKDNIGLFLALEEGGQVAEDAWNQIIEKSRDAWLEINNISGQKKDELLGIIADIDEADFGIDGTADFSKIFTELANLLGSAAEAAAFLESMNYEVTWKPVHTQSILPPSIAIDPALAGMNVERVALTSYKAVVTKGNYSGTGTRTPSGGGGGGGGKEEKWENPYDEFYNITEQINEELRTREKIEHDYNKLLKDRRTSIDEIRQSQLDQIASLRRELDLQQQLLEGRKRQYSEIGQETYADEEGNYKSFSEWGVTKYASYDDKTGLITIDWESIDQITDTELGGALEAYISQIEEWSGSIEDIEDEIRDIEDQIEEIKDAEKDTYLEFEERIYEALVEADQKVIDTYQELSDTISDSNEKILNSLSESIELERQIRDNTKTEEEIADKEARLAYLRRDTSGANDLEIKQLEEELADARESYGDTLIDQELDRLNKVNEEANAQREQQIALMQAQLDWNEQNGIYWARVDSLLDGAINSDGTFNYNSELAKLLEESDAFKGMSAFGQMNWINELVEEFLTANRGFENWMVDRAEEEGMVVLANGKTASYNRDNQTWTDESGNSYEDLVYNADTKTYSLTNPIKKEEAEDSDTSTGGGGTTTQPEVEKPVLDENTKRGVSAAIWRGSSTSGWGQGSTRSARLKEVFGENDIQDNYVNKNVMSGFTGSVSDYTYANMKKKFLGFKTGGLADFTGPAWLDGTKTRPELVLNQQDTQNFIQLKDILSSLLNRGSSNTQTSGDNYYNFDITVEEIGNDYDVDQMIDRVRERIYDDASYRNVNAINFLR